MKALTSCGHGGTGSTLGTGAALRPRDFVLLCDLNLQKPRQGEKYVVHQIHSWTMWSVPRCAEMVLFDF